MDDVTLSQFIEHRAYFRQSLSGCSFVSSLAQVAHSVTSCLSIVVVVCFARCRLANTLQRAFVICHLCFLLFCILRALRGSPVGDCFIGRSFILFYWGPRRALTIVRPVGRSSAKGNRTPIARMKILSTNRYTMAPGGVPVNRGIRWHPEVSPLIGETGLRRKGHSHILDEKPRKITTIF